MLSFTTGKCKYKINIYKLLLGVRFAGATDEREDCENGLNALLKARRNQDLKHLKRQPIEPEHRKEQKSEISFEEIQLSVSRASVPMYVIFSLTSRMSLIIFPFWQFLFFFHHSGRARVLNRNRINKKGICCGKSYLITDWW